MGTPAPKPENYDELVRTWNDPAAFARERNRYYAQLRAQRAAAAAEATRDITEPLRGRD